MKVCSALVVLTGLATVSVVHASDYHEDLLIDLMLKAEKPVVRPHAVPQSATGPELCYKPFGCFPRFPPGIFPEPPFLVNPKFKLYIPTAENEVMVYNYKSKVGNEDGETKKSLADPSKKLVFVVHGFGESSSAKWVQAVKNAKKGIYGNNVISLDWANGARASTLYLGAAANTVLVARIASFLCLQLVGEYKIPLSNVEVVGFSLGAQLSGFFAKEIFERTGEKIGRITALDCAAPAFESRGIYPSTEHAHYLEAVHTSAGRGLFHGRVGITVDYGHADYYINGGVHQPGCSIFNVACSHTRAHEYYLEAITGTDVCLYQGYLCDSVEDAHSEWCQQELDPTHFIGQLNYTTDHRILLVQTKSFSPFCIPQSQTEG